MWKMCSGSCMETSSLKDERLWKGRVDKLRSKGTWVSGMALTNCKLLAWTWRSDFPKAGTSIHLYDTHIHRPSTFQTSPIYSYFFFINRSSFEDRGLSPPIHKQGRRRWRMPVVILARANTQCSSTSGQHRHRESWLQLVQQEHK